MKYIPELGGHVPWRNTDMETSVKGIYAAGDAAGVEEASSAMVEGYLAGLCASKSLGYCSSSFEELKSDLALQLYSLRSGPTGQKIRSGLQKLSDWGNAK